MLTVGSLFSGIGGLELGLERAGMRVVWQVEKDAFCRKVLAKHWPSVTRFEDVKDVGQANLAPVDLICGGFPCQDISVAGRREGILPHTRSGLWFEFARIIREIRPSYALLENVTALLAEGLDTVLGELAESGYDAEWDCIPASSVGAPHQRDRIFVLAYSKGDRRQGSGAWNEGRNADPTRGVGLRLQSPRSRPDGAAQAPTDTAGQRLEGRQQPETARTPFGFATSLGGNAGVNHWSVEPNVGRVANGIPARIHRLRALGNAVVPQVAEYIGRLIVEADKELRGAA